MFGLFFLTVKHQRNEVLPGFGIGVSSAKLTRWEISVFSCWQSIYLPSNVEYVCGMNTERHEKMEEEKEVDVAVCVRSFSCWEMFLSGELHNSPWIITPPWIIQSHMSLEPISIDTPVNVKTSTKEWHDFFSFPHSSSCALFVFYFVSASLMWTPAKGCESLCFCGCVLDMTNIPEPVLGKVVQTLKEGEKHPHIMQYWLVLKSVW